MAARIDDRLPPRFAESGPSSSKCGKILDRRGTFSRRPVFEKESFAVQALLDQGISQFDVIQEVSHGQAGDSEDARADAMITGESRSSQSSGGTARMLDQFAVNLNQKASEGKTDPLIGRHDVLERIMQILARRTKIIHFSLVNRGWERPR